MEYQDDQQNVHLDPIVKSVSWSGDIKQAARKLVVELSNTGDQREIYMTYKKGGELRLIWDEKLELFRGVLFADQLNSKGQMTLTAYDENIYLTKSKDTKIFRNMTASSVIKKLCGEFSISIGEIQDTGYVIPKLVFRDKTLFEMMVMSLTESQNKTGKWYHLTSRRANSSCLPVKSSRSNGCWKTG